MILDLLRHRKTIFKHEFKRIVYCLPSKAMPQHREYIDELEKIFPEVEVEENVPDLSRLGLEDADDGHKV